MASGNEIMLSHLNKLAEKVVKDERWKVECDDFSLSIFGMLLYGYALSVGLVFGLPKGDFTDAMVAEVIMKHTGAAEKWTTGLVAEARRSAFDKAYHSGQYDLIAAGHTYMDADNVDVMVDNVFGNIKVFRDLAVKG